MSNKPTLYKPTSEHWNQIQRIYNRSNHPALIKLSKTNRMATARQCWKSVKVDPNWYATYQSLLHDHAKYMESTLKKKAVKHKKQQSLIIDSMFRSNKTQKRKNDNESN